MVMMACLLVDGAGIEPRGGPFRFCLPARGRVMALGLCRTGGCRRGLALSWAGGGGAVMGWGASDGSNRLCRIGFCD
jgi:hypothetical protein